MNKPFIYLAFVADPKNGQDVLYSLKHEEEDIRFTLGPSDAAGLLNYKAWNRVTGKILIKSLPDYRKQLTVFHFGGHANSIDLAFSDENYSVEHLTRMLGDGSFPNLKLVVLNGCSTQGFVERLHEAGVKAVIATTKQVGDQHAADFAVHFYRTLVVAKQPLERAFLQATTTLGVNAEKVRIHRGIKLESEEGGEFPWGLYINENLSDEDQLAILNWQLINEHSVPGLLPDSSKQHIKALQTLQEEYREGLPKIQKQQRKAERYRQRALEAEEEEDREDFLEDANRLESDAKKWLAEKRAKMNGLYEQVISAAQGKWEQELEEDIQEQLEYLNFKPQRREFEEAVHSNSPYAFIIRGTRECGHEILIKRLLRMEQIDYNNRFTKVEISFAHQAQSMPSEQNIWTMIRNALNDYSLPDRVEDVFQHLMKRCYVANTVHPLVFLFMDVFPSVDRNVAIIQQFWQQFIQCFKQAEPPKHLPKPKIFLFVLDKHCSREGSRQSEKDPRYQEMITEKKLDQFHTILLPNIRHVSKEDLQDWFDYRDLPSTIRDKKRELLDYFAQHEPAVLPGMAYICKTTGYDEVFQGLMHRYRIDYYATSAPSSQISKTAFQQMQDSL